MATGNAYDQYRQQQIASSPSDKILLMLYDGAIRFCEKAKVAILEKDVQEANNYIIKVERIIEELRSCLDMSYDISHNLYSLYDYMYNRLMEANLKKEIPMLEEVVQMLTELRQTWSLACIEAKKNQEELATEDSYQTSSSVEDTIKKEINQSNSVVSDIKMEPEQTFGIKTAAAKSAEVRAMMPEKPPAAPTQLASNHMASYYSAMNKPVTQEDAAGAAKVSISSKPNSFVPPSTTGQPNSQPPRPQPKAPGAAPSFMRNAPGQPASPPNPAAAPKPAPPGSKPQGPLTPGSVNFES